MRGLAITGLVLTAVAVAGCGAVGRVTQGDPAHGKTLFVAKCGACHTLANAKTSGTIGPDLDNAFAAAKDQGFRISTVVDVVRGQIAYPDSRPGTVCRRSIRTSAGHGLSCTSTQGMTANLAHGQDARDIALYVGLCSAEPHCVVKNETIPVPKN